MRRKAPAIFAAAYVTATVGAMFVSAGLAIASPEVREVGLPGVIWSLPFAAIAFIGALVTWRRSANVTGWVLAAAGLLMVCNATLQDYTLFGYSTDSPRFGAATASWLALWTWMPASQMLGLFFLLFPTGSAVSRAWRPVVRGTLALIVATVAAAVPTWGSRGPHLLDVSTPEVPGGDLLFTLSNYGFGIVVLAGLVSLTVRYRRGGEVERHQIKWLLFAAGLVLGALGLAGVAATVKGTDDPMSVPIVAIGTLLAASSVPVAAGIAILRYRLYDIDVVINKTVVYGALAAFISAVYVGVVVGIGSLVGAGGKPNLGLSLAATAIVAVAFQPVRERVQRLANKLVYGERVTPYEAVTSFSHRMAESLSLDKVLPQMAEAAAKGVGGTRSRVKLFLPGGGEQVVTWPVDSSDNSFDRAVEVIHQGEQVGEIAVAKAPGEQITKSEEKLLSDLASQAGLAMRNLRLTGELQQKLVELQESRKRIVAAQDEERRRMERDIHDGAQQQLVSLAVKLGLAKTLLYKDPAKATSLLDELRNETDEMVETLRDLARGLFPQILVDRGLAQAIDSHIAKMTIDAELQNRIGDVRFDPEAEANAYFCIREALQNASKHAPGCSVVITLSTLDDRLAVSVKDDGPGFDPEKVKAGSGLQNMADRAEALGGTFEIETAPGRGTEVRAFIPARVLEVTA